MAFISDEYTEHYLDDAGEHRWRTRARNGKIVGAASEGFSSELASRQNASLLGILLTSDERERLQLLCKELESKGIVVQWHPAKTVDGEDIEAHWEVIRLPPTDSTT